MLGGSPVATGKVGDPHYLLSEGCLHDGIVRVILEGDNLASSEDQVDVSPTDEDDPLYSCRGDLLTPDDPSPHEVADQREGVRRNMRVW